MTPVDEVAVLRAMTGEPLPLTMAERREVVRRLIQRGLSDTAVAATLGCAPGTVVRDRRWLRSPTPFRDRQWRRDPASQQVVQRRPKLPPITGGECAPGCKMCRQRIRTYRRRYGLETS